MEWVQEFFRHLYHFDALIRWGGYTVLVGIVFAETGLLAGCFLPGDSLLVTAGLMAASGTLHVWTLIGVLTLAAATGDSVGYAIGYHAGPRLFTRQDSRLFHRDHLIRTQRFFERHGAKTIVLARFVPIIRTFAPPVAGVGKMPYRSFLCYNILGGGAWVVSMVGGGFWLGNAIPHLDRHLHWVIGAVILASFLPLLRAWCVSRTQK